jgi:hypothetical protein
MESNTMKKTSVILLIMFLFTLFFPGAVLAENKNPIIKGDVKSINQDEGTISISTEEGNIIVIHVPPNFNFNNISIGSQMLAKVYQSQNGSVVADWIKEVSKGSNDLEIEEGEEKEILEGKFNSSYCSGEKENDHPFAAAIAETYETLVSDVMGYFCNGFGFGEIMLALQTHQMNNEEISSMLDLRKSNHGWGQIWQEMGMIGNPDKAKSPPGQLKKPNQTDIE